MHDVQPPDICPGASARTRQARERDGERYDENENREYPVDSATRIVGRRSLPKAEEHTPSGYRRQKPIRAWQYIRATSHAAIAPSAELAARPIEDPESSRFINRLNRLSRYRRYATSRAEALLAEDLRFARVDGNDAVPVPSKVERHEVTRAQVILRQAHNRDGLRAVQHPLDRQRVLVPTHVERRASSRRALRYRRLAGPCKTLVEIPDQIVDRFGSD